MSVEDAIYKFVVEQKELLALELKASEEGGGGINTDESASKRFLSSLHCTEVSVGLYGRTVVTLGFAPDQDGGERLLPPHKLTVGDDVEIHSKSSKTGKGGVVSVVTDTSLSIALYGGGGGGGNSTGGGSQDRNKDGVDEEEEDIVGPPPLSVIPKSSVEVHKKLTQALNDLKAEGLGHPTAANLIHACFAATEDRSDFVAANKDLSEIQWRNQRLDYSQQEAIQFALTGNRPVTCIHGPPGTGKTTTIAELIHQAVSLHDYKVLVTAPSNVAVDNVLERLVQMQQQQSDNQKSGGKRKNRRQQRQQRLKAVRLGHPARIKPAILPYSLESLVQASDGTEIVRDVRSELQSFLQILQHPKSREKKVAYREVKILRREIRSRENKIVQDLLKETPIVLATNVGAANRVLNTVEFDLVVIDEAAQALEASCWIPALRGKRLVLAGDHCQLPPTIQHPKLQDKLGHTMFERILKLYQPNGQRVSRMLKVQYRMHQGIANWASRAMYHGELETHELVKERTLQGQPTLLLIDTAGCVGMEEHVNGAGSRYNPGEAELVARHARALLTSSDNLKPEDIAIISPYNGQVELLKQLLREEFPKLEIRSVDGFQGGEREAVVLSLVRSNDDGTIGFLKDNRRLNVAITRAKRHVAVICDCETVSKNAFIEGLIDWIDEHGEHLSVMQLQHSEEEPDEMEKDLADAESEIMKLALEEKEKAKAKKETKKEKPQVSAGPAPLQSLPRKPSDEEKRNALMDKISKFADTGKEGDELVLSSELSRFDRRVVHEFATQLGLRHESQGIEGVDRRIVLKILKQVKDPPNKAAETIRVEDSNEKISSKGSLFAALEDDSEESENDNDEKKNDSVEVQEEKPQSMNPLLGALAAERRQREQRSGKVPIQAPQPAGGNKKGKKKGGQKLGGSKPMKVKDKEEFPDDMDDMTFLDAQINKVQNSHGRKVEGRGAYKTIVNGILISKPAPAEPKKNTRASSALHARLKEAQSDRRSKKGGKKKKK